MPFQSTSDPLAPDPDVKILFFGMLLLYPENGGCAVGVHAKSDYHELYLTVSVEGAPLPPIAFVKGTLRKPFNIMVTGGAVMGVSKYVASDDFDFNAAVDLQKIHPGKELRIDPAYTMPGIYFNEGVLYTGRLTPLGLEVLIGPPNGPYKPFSPSPVAYPIAANMSFGGRKIELTWEDDGGARILTLPRENTSNEKYVILVNNGENPVIEPPVLKPGEVACGDYIDYYQVVSGVAASDQPNICFTPIIESEKDFRIEGASTLPVATRVPCMAVVVDG